MENDHQSIEDFEQFRNTKSASKEINLNNKYKVEINMDSTSNKINALTSQVSLSSGKTISTTNSPKMGSRRIFTPQFKLQVLESYRNDHDCKGNQRATARKYNIHRRQIQKWLQCEASLRSSVANINQNSVKHQFHNISMQHEQPKNFAIASQSSVNDSSYTSNQLRSGHLCFDSTEGSTSHKPINVPSLISSTQESHNILDLNLVGAVTAAAGSTARTNTSSTSSTAIVSPLRTSAIISTNINTNSSISPLFHHDRSHHYGISTYGNMSSTANVPILVHHLTNSHQTPYQYQCLPYSSPSLTHHQTEKLHSTSYFTPISLPAFNVLSAASSAPNSYAGGDNDHMDKFDLFPMGNKTYPKIVSDKSFFYNDKQFPVNYERNDAKVMNSSSTLDSFTENPFNGNFSYSTTYPYGPMDLSLRNSREAKSELDVNIKSRVQITETPIKQESTDNGIDVVDLTYRKRKVYNSNNDYKNEYPEKLQKFSNPEEVQNNFDTYNVSANYPNLTTANPSNSNEDDDIEIEVGVEEKFPQTSKPVKLFKPYLLDECENNDDSCLDSTFCELSKDKKDIVKEDVNICGESSNFLVESRSESPRRTCSPATCIPTISPTNYQYAKGSPASSGYESSTSSYSDISLSSRNDTYANRQTYSVNLQMQNVFQENIHVHHQSNHVQTWLEKDDSDSLETNSTIALLV